MNIAKNQILAISTHTLTWSVTPLFIDTEGSTKISTHTLTWSVTNLQKMFKDCMTISTHTLTWSVTWLIKQKSHLMIFQLTRSRGA